MNITQKARRIAARAAIGAIMLSAAAHADEGTVVFHESFDAFADGEQPSSLVEVQYAPRDYGEVVNAAYAIHHNLNAHCPVTPSLSDFTVEFKARRPWRTKVAVIFVDFRLNLARQEGFRLYYRWGESNYFQNVLSDDRWKPYWKYIPKTTRLALLNFAHRKNLEPILTKGFSVFGSPSGPIPILQEAPPESLHDMTATDAWQQFRIEVAGHSVRFFHNALLQGEMTIPAGAYPTAGAIGFDTYGFRSAGSLLLDDIRITSTDPLPAPEPIFSGSFAIPSDARAIHEPLNHIVSITRLSETWLKQIRATPSNGRMYRVDMTFDFPTIVGKGRDMAAQTPYVRLEHTDGRPFFIHNIYRGILGSLVPGHKSSAAYMLQLMKRSPDHLPHYGVALRRTGPADVTGLQSATAFISELPDDFHIVAGLDYSLDGGHLINGGPIEAVYAKDGTLLYAGLPLRGTERTLTITSGQSPGLAARVGASNRYRDAYLERLRNDHYFLEGETPVFTLVLRGGPGASLPATASWEVLDALRRPLNLEGREALHNAGDDEHETLRRMGRKVAGSGPITVSLPGPGVYWLRCQAGELHDEVAFSVIPAEGRPGDSAAMRSGLPDIFGQLYPMQPWRQDYGHYVSGTRVRDADDAKTVHAFNVKAFAPSRPSTNLLSHVDGIWMPNGIEDVEIPTRIYPRGGRLWSPQASSKAATMQAFLNSPFYRRQPGDDILSEPEAPDADRWEAITRRHFKAWIDYWATVRTQNETAFRTVLDALYPGLELATHGPSLVNSFQYGNLYAAKYGGWDYRLMQPARRLIDTWQMETYAHNFARPPESYTPSIALTSMTIPELGCRWSIYGASASVADHRDRYGRPPHGFNWPSRRFMTHQVTELMLAPWYFRDGVFKQAGNTHIGPGFEKYTQPMLFGFIDGMRYAQEARAQRLVRCPVFVRSYAAAERDPAWREGKVSNAAAETPAYAYLQARLAGLPGGFFTDISDLRNLSAGDCDMLVLPPMRGATVAQIRQIRKLYQEGVALVGFDDCTGLEDLFGVRRLDTARQMECAARHPDSDLLNGLPLTVQRETIAHVAEVAYERAGAEEILSACDKDRNRVAPLLTYHHPEDRPGAVFFTLGATEVGRQHESLTESHIEGAVVSPLIQQALQAAMNRISRSVMRVAAPASLLAVRRADGTVYAVVMDSSWPYIPMGRGPVATTLTLDAATASVQVLDGATLSPSHTQDGRSLYRLTLNPDEVVPMLIHGVPE